MTAVPDDRPVDELLAEVALVTLEVYRDAVLATERKRGTSDLASLEAAQAREDAIRRLVLSAMRVSDP